MAEVTTAIVCAALLLCLLLCLGVVIDRFHNPCNHNGAFRLVRLKNWVPVAGAYSFLYFARFNVEAANMNRTRITIDASKGEFGVMIGIAYFIAFVTLFVCGGLVDQVGGRRVIVWGCLVSAFANCTLGGVLSSGFFNSITVLVLLEAINFSAQAMACCAAIKVCSAWYKENERGVFGGVFNSFAVFGIFLAFVVGGQLMEAFSWWTVFVVPGLLLFACSAFASDVDDSPAESCEGNFITSDSLYAVDETQTTDGEDIDGVAVREVALSLLGDSRFVLTCLTFCCNGFCRESITIWLSSWSNVIAGVGDGPVLRMWFGLSMTIGGMVGGYLCGPISDHFFDSDRLPVLILFHGAQLLFSMFLVHAETYFTRVMAIAGFSMCLWGLHALMMFTMVLDFSTASAVGTSAAIMKALQYAGCAFAGFTSGFIVDSYGYSAWKESLVVASSIGLALSIGRWSLERQRASFSRPGLITTTPLSTPRYYKASGSLAECTPLAMTPRGTGAVGGGGTGAGSARGVPVHPTSSMGTSTVGQYAQPLSYQGAPVDQTSALVGPVSLGR